MIGYERENLCLENAKEEESEAWVTPCLRHKGHLGKHIHKALCVTPFCTCFGFDDKLKMGGSSRAEEFPEQKHL